MQKNDIMTRRDIARMHQQFNDRMMLWVILLCVAAWSTAGAFTLHPKNGKCTNTRRIQDAGGMSSISMIETPVVVGENVTTAPEEESLLPDYKSSTVHTLILCRHGDSIWNGGEPGTRETFTGWTDVPLSPKGIGEAQSTGRQLANFFNYDHAIDVCFTSVLQRAQLTAHYCLWALSSPSAEEEIERYWRPSQQRTRQPQQNIRYVMDYRLNERHYGALQGYVKEDVERGLHKEIYDIDEDDPGLVQRWRRSWHTVPPLLNEHDSRRLREISKYQHFVCIEDDNNDSAEGDDICSENNNYLLEIPRGESLQQVARNRIRPFMKDVVSPILNDAAKRTSMNNDDIDLSNDIGGGTALIVAHANSLRALIGVVCSIDNDEDDNCPLNRNALKNLEALRLSTGVPLVLKYRHVIDNENDEESYEVCDLYGRSYRLSGNNDNDEDEDSNGLEITKGLPVYPLSCIPKPTSLRARMGMD